MASTQEAYEMPPSRLPIPPPQVPIAPGMEQVREQDRDSVLTATWTHIAECT